MARVLLSPRLSPTGEAVPLSVREKEIVQLVVAGCGNQDIALRLCISENTVKNHLSNIFDKLGISAGAN